LIQAEYGQFAKHGHRANQKVGVGALNALGLALVEKLRSALVVLSGEGFIRKCLEDLPQTVKLRWVFDAAEQFLTYWGDQQRAGIGDEIFQRFNGGLAYGIRWYQVSTQGE
jgi:hypothetical protein